LPWGDEHAPNRNRGGRKEWRNEDGRAQSDASPPRRALSTKPADEVEVEAGQGSADLMHCTTRFEGPEVDGDKSDAVDQLDHQLFGFGVVSGGKDDGAGLVVREVLYPFHRDVTDRFNKPCAKGLLGNNFTRCTPFQCGARSSNPRQTDVGFEIHMRVSRIDQNSAMPIDTFQRFRHFHPIRGENNDLTLGSQLFSAGDCARTQINDKISQFISTLASQFPWILS
jgi:hypothetical protein